MSIALCVALGAFITLSACSNAGEGERCQVQNNNDDCASPLQCVPAGQINAGFNSSDRCCPVDRSTATHPACTLQSNPIGGDSAPPPDTGPTNDAAGNDASKDTGADAADANDADDANDAADADGG